MADDKTSVDRRGFLKYAATGAVAAAVPNSMHAQEHDHDHAHDHDHLRPVAPRRPLEASRAGAAKRAVQDGEVGRVEAEPARIGRAACRLGAPRSGYRDDGV